MSEVLISDNTFSSLNYWRKVYLAAISVIIATYSLVWANALTTRPAESLIIFSIVFIFSAGLGVWNYNAVIDRNIRHLQWICVLNLFSVFSIIGSLILLAIIRVTNNETN